MDTAEFNRLFGYELVMSDAWQKSSADGTGCMRLFQIQSEKSMEDIPPQHLLCGRIENRTVSAGFLGNRLAVCFHLDALLEKRQQIDRELDPGQRKQLLELQNQWNCLEEKQGLRIYRYQKNDLGWLPRVRDVLTLGIVGLYDRYREEQEEWARYPEYIGLMNGMIDRYKYIVCKMLAEEKENSVLHMSYQALGRIKYLPPRQLFEAVQMLLLHCQIFRVSTLDCLDEILLPFFENDLRDESVSVEFHAAVLSDFLSRFRFSAYTIGEEPLIRLSGTGNTRLNHLVMTALEDSEISFCMN